jgi:DNA-binding transcriptional MerR regulator
MNIGEAARKSGVPAKRIRHYEHTGLLPEPARSKSGYRVYQMADIQRLRLIRIAQNVGVPFAELRILLGLWHDGKNNQAFREHLYALIAKLDQRRLDMHGMIADLQDLVGTKRPARARR